MTEAIPSPAPEQEIKHLADQCSTLLRENERLRERNQEHEARYDALEAQESERKAEVERLQKRIDTLVAERGAERKLYNDAIVSHLAEIKRLKEGIKTAEKMLYDSGFMLGEAHEEISRLKAERNTTKEMLEDVLKKYGVGTTTPHYGLGRSGAT